LSSRKRGEDGDRGRASREDGAMDFSTRTRSRVMFSALLVGALCCSAVGCDSDADVAGASEDASPDGASPTASSTGGHMGAGSGGAADGAGAAGNSSSTGGHVGADSSVVAGGAGAAGADACGRYNQDGWCPAGLSCLPCGPWLALCTTRCTTDSDCGDPARPRCNQEVENAEGVCTVPEATCYWGAQ
jgi:hypothetical protein